VVAVTVTVQHMSMYIVKTTARCAKGVNGKVAGLLRACGVNIVDKVTTG